MSDRELGTDAAPVVAATLALGDSLGGSGLTLRWTPAETQQVIATLRVAGTLLAIVALADLGVRSAVRLELLWDTFAYHLPFAALRGGLSIPYEMNDQMRPAYDGYPPLPELVQGLLWRLTGSMNATGVVNYLALAGFLAYCHRALRAPFWLVALVCLTAPLVVIHSSISYIDLFGNAFLAAGAASCVYLFLFPDEAGRAVLLGGLVGVAGAAWSKYLLVPVAALVFVVLTVLVLRPPRAAGFSRRKAALFCGITAVVSAAPYVKNWVAYGNPFWPFRLPFIGDWFPFTNDAITGGTVEQPVALRQRSQVESFIHSLFEIHHPTSYLNRPRWIADQGNSHIAFRMGGFWNVAVAVYLVAVIVLLVVCHRRRGIVVGAGVLGMLGFVALLPQSHQLRYYLFIPLCGAAIVGMLFQRFQHVAPRCAAALLTVTLGLFVHMVFENRAHYRLERVGQTMASFAWGAEQRWPELERGTTYCAVNMGPRAFLLTGPTLSEYTIVDRSRASLCPAGSVQISLERHATPTAG